MVYNQSIQPNKNSTSQYLIHGLGIWFSLFNLFGAVDFSGEGAAKNSLVLLQYQGFGQICFPINQSTNNKHAHHSSFPFVLPAIQSIEHSANDDFLRRSSCFTAAFLARSLRGDRVAWPSLEHPELRRWLQATSIRCLSACGWICWPKTAHSKRPLFFMLLVWCVCVRGNSCFCLAL